MLNLEFRIYRTKSKEMIYGFKGCSLTYILDIWECEKHVSKPMQYTGLLDIKGNKIFNKDLIKDDENFIWEVFYKQGAFYVKCDDLMAEQLLSSVNLYGVVIGNVFEKEDGHEKN